MGGGGIGREPRVAFSGLLFLNRFLELHGLLAVTSVLGVPCVLRLLSVLAVKSELGACWCGAQERWKMGERMRCERTTVLRDWGERPGGGPMGGDGRAGEPECSAR